MIRNKNNRKRGFCRIRALVACVAGLLAFACNTDMEYRLTGSYPESVVPGRRGRVMMIVIDGAAGRTVNVAYNAKGMPALKEMLPHSVYTFDGLADVDENLDVMSAERGWANLMTGVSTHGIVEGDETFSPERTPSFLELIRKADPGVRTGLYASSREFAEWFGYSADTVCCGEDRDDQVKETVIRELMRKDSLPEVMVVQFSGVQKAGEANGFYQGTTADPTDEVMAALKVVDGYIGQIMETLETRPDYTQEDWLVIITSNYGGTYTGSLSSSLYSDAGKNTFTLMYNSRLATAQLKAPADDEAKVNYVFYSPRYSYSTTRSASVKDVTLFNMEKGKSYTVQFMFYEMNRNPSGQQVIISKADYNKKGNAPKKGWVFEFKTNASAKFFSNNLKKDNGMSTDYSTWNSIGGGKMRKDGKWHTFTFVWDAEKAGSSKNQCTLTVYQDGKFARANPAMDTTVDMTTETPFTIGYVDKSDQNAATDFFVTHVQFYDVALPEDYIAMNHCKTRLDLVKGKYWDHLIGYWPGDIEEDYGKDYLPDYSQYGSVYRGVNAGKSDMMLNYSAGISESFCWYRDPDGSYQENVCPALDASFYRKVFVGVDVSYQVMQWLGVIADPAWKLEGYGRSLKYAYQN